MDPRGATRCQQEQQDGGQEELTCTLAFTRFRMTRSWPVAVSSMPCTSDQSILTEVSAAKLATQCNLHLFVSTSSQ